MKRSTRATKQSTAARTAGPRSRAETGRPDSGDVESRGPMMMELYRHAEARLRLHKKPQKSTAAGVVKAEADAQRLLHELQAHQVELEMQNAELSEARDQMEVLLVKYTDLYDFAPVGYLSLGESGKILEVNLNGATLLGVSRARVINRPLPSFITPASRPALLAFLQRIFTGGGKQVCEAAVLQEGGKTIWAAFHGTNVLSDLGSKKWCRVVVSDITALKRAEESQRHSDAMAAANDELRQEIERRKKIEESLKKSQRHQGHLLNQSRHMQEQLRNLSRQVLQAQEEERKRISRELHDVIAQTLTGINIRLATLKREAGGNIKNFDRNLARTQRLVEKSVKLVHDFARELRPAVLDDLGLIPALHSFTRKFNAETGIHVQLTASAEVEKLETSRRAVLFRVTQEALTNVASHAKASRVQISVRKLPHGVCLKIKDNGKSFSVERQLHASTGKRLGLLGMRERLEMVGGSFAVESAPGQGTTIIAQIPHGKVSRRMEGVPRNPS